jgi:hypothetical protein
VFLLAALVIAAADVTHVAIPRGAGLPEREPAAVGMSAERLGTIDRVVQRGVDAGGFPGAAPGYAYAGELAALLDARVRVAAAPYRRGGYAAMLAA